MDSLFLASLRLQMYAVVDITPLLQDSSNQQQQHSKQIPSDHPPISVFFSETAPATPPTAAAIMASTAHSSSSRSWSEMPAEIMQQIVLLLPVQDRLVSCALISTAWAAAAAAAPVTCVDLFHRDAESLQRVWQHYLVKLNCQQLSSVRLAVEAARKHPSVDDPFSNAYDQPFNDIRDRVSLVKGLPAGLRALELSRLSLGLNASAEQLQSARRLLPAYRHSRGGMAAAAAAAQAATVQHGVPVDALASLTRLRLDSVRLRTDNLQPVSTAAFMQLTALRHLHLHKVQCDEIHSLSTGGVILSSLQQLTYLNITDCSWCFFAPAALTHLTALTGLLHFGLGDSQACYYGQQPLPRLKDCLLSLTQLTALELTRYDRRIPAPGFAALPKLRRLCLGFGRIDLAALTAVRGLQHLGMGSCDFDSNDYGDWQQCLQAQVAFFGWLQLQPLTHLSFSQGVALHTMGAVASAQAAVTASTALRELHCPELFLQCPTQRQLLQLTALSCSCSSDAAKQLVRCCPAVKQLTFYYGRLQPELLLALTALTSLSLTRLEDDKIPQLLQLTGLQALSVNKASISDQGMLQLTALQQLTRLEVCSDGFSRSMRAAIGSSDCINVREGALKPPVWQQLLTCCEEAEERQRPG